MFVGKNKSTRQNHSPPELRTLCAKLSPLPSSPDGLHSLLMPPSPPSQQGCHARTHLPTTTSMASCHHAANSSPTCHVSPLPLAEPQPPLKEHGLDLAPLPRRLETNQSDSRFVAWRLPGTTVQHGDSAGKRCEEKVRPGQLARPERKIKFPLDLATVYGQGGSCLHAGGEPVFEHNMYATTIYTRQKLTDEVECEFHTTSSRASSLHDPTSAYFQYA